MAKIACDIPRQDWDDPITGLILEHYGVQLWDYCGFYVVICKAQEVAQEYEMFSSAESRYIELLNQQVEVIDNG